MFKVKVTVRVQNVSVCLSGLSLYLLNTEHLVTKLNMVMQHHEPECHVKNSCLLSSSQCNSEGSYDQNVILFYSSSDLLTLWQSNLV